MDPVKPTPNKSLAELENLPDPPPAAAAPPPAITPGNGTPTPADLAAQQAAQAAEAAAAHLETLKTKDPAQLTDEDKATLTKAGIEVVEAGTEDGDEEDDTTEDFWGEVDKLRGETIEIDWTKHLDSENNPIDPTSPQGALIREKAIAQNAIDKFEAHLSKEDPRAYAYILHRQAGGTDEDFFGNKTTVLPDYEEFKSSVDLQQKFYKESLVLKGVADKTAQKIVDEAVKDKTILEDADKEYQSRKVAQDKELANITKKLEQEQTQYAQKVAAFDKLLTDEISTNSTMKFIVPEAKKIEFTQYVRNQVQIADGKFYAVQEIEDKSLPRLLEALYLQFAGGNVKDLVIRQARTQNAQRLRLQVDKNKKPKDSSTPPKGGKVVLGDL